VPTLAVVKTRGSDHDRQTYGITIAEGGIRLLERLGDGNAKGNKKRPRAK
jgi:hypothetical protein